ncbi:type IV toxin-antitoxin system AbiEi family antitoxin [Curtobacterium sp. 1544]|uniref:type IV toxin-antitoxin system AbiEi family antitoxin n=1 Tax=Curtobacterium sp. 1544 TaxID=3156417 RepID=UPI003396194C
MPRSRLVTSDDWPEVELRAAVLAGELVPVGACWASPVEPQTPSLRAAAAAWTLRDARLIAGTRTAAWIWGATSRPPTPLEAAISPQARVHVDAGVLLREVVIDPADLVRLDPLRVTTPSRTAIDLLRTPNTGERTFGTAEAEAVQGLIAIGAVTVAEVEDRLCGLGTIPMVRQASRRLRALLESGAAAVDGR